MDAKFEFLMKDGCNPAGGFIIKDSTFTEAIAFGSTTVLKICQDLHGFAVDHYGDEGAAAGVVLKCMQLALDSYAEHVGADTMQAAYDYNAAYDSAYHEKR